MMDHMYPSPVSSDGFSIEDHGFRLEEINSDDVLDCPVYYVNPRQFHRIVKRRAAKEKMVEDGRIPYERMRVLHVSRSVHSNRRRREINGKFAGHPPGQPSLSKRRRKGKGRTDGEDEQEDEDEEEVEHRDFPSPRPLSPHELRWVHITTEVILPDGEITPSLHPSISSSLNGVFYLGGDHNIMVPDGVSAFIPDDPIIDVDRTEPQTEAQRLLRDFFIS